MPTGSPAYTPGFPQLPAPELRLVGLVSLAAAEVIGVTVRHWWTGLFGEFGEYKYLNAVALTAALAVTVFAGGHIRREFIGFASQFRVFVIPWPVIVTQVTVYLAFLWLTAVGAVGDLRNSFGMNFWTAAWTATGVVAAILWCRAVLPFRAWGRVVRQGWKAVAFALLTSGAAWAASRYTESCWEQLSDATLSGAEFLLRLLFPSVTVIPAARSIEVAGFNATIGESCSGYEGLGLTLTFLGCYLWFCRGELRFPFALVLLPVGLAASFALNAVRIAALIAIGAWGAPQTASDGFHSQAGWLAFNAVALGLIVVSRCSPLFARASVGRRSGPTINPAAPYLAPLVVVVASGMVAGAFTADGFEWLYPIRVAAAGLTIRLYWREYSRLGWGWSWVAAGAGLGVFAAWLGLEFALPPPGGNGPAGFTTLPPGAAGVWLIARVTGAVVTVPLAEELAFRGYLLRRLQGADLTADMKGRWNWFAVPVSALIFGILHPDRWVAGTLAGVVYAWVFVRRGRLADAVIAHSVTNAALAAYVISTGHWALW